VKGGEKEMNLYEITATFGNSDPHIHFWAAKTEQDARNSFEEAYDKDFCNILDIKFVREHVCTVRQKKRDALETIKKMVESLGPRNCLAIAFEGVFRDAENNINNDTSFSYKRRYDQAVKAQESAEDQIKHMQHTIDRLQAALEIKTAPSISPADLRYIIFAEVVSCEDCKNRMKDAAERIVSYADDPTSEQFTDAVHEHRDLADTIGVKKERLKRLRKVLDAMFDDPQESEASNGET